MTYINDLVSDEILKQLTLVEQDWLENVFQRHGGRYPEFE